MHIKNLIAIVSGLLMLTACSKKALPPPTETGTWSTATLRVFEAKSLSSMRQAYALLSPDEKQNLWKAKYTAILRNDANILTADQRKIVESLHSFLRTKTVKALLENPSEGDVFFKQNSDYFSANFKREEIFMLIENAYFCDNFSIFNAGKYLTAIMDRKSASPTAAFSAEIPNCGCLYTASCFFGTDGSCDTKVTCNKVQECGVWGTSNCTGICTGSPNHPE